MKIILQEDLVLLQHRLEQVEKELFELGEEFKEAVNQSSETWHDNAPFDAARDKQTLLDFERRDLREVLKTHKAVPSTRSKTICRPGSIIKLSHLDSPIYLAGSISVRQFVEAYRVISSEAPLGMQVLGKKVGTHCRIGTTEFTIDAITVRR